MSGGVENMQKEDLNINKFIKYIMNKRGQILELGAIIIIIIASFGVFQVFSESEHIYIGDNREGTFYDYKICPNEINSIPKENMVIFNNLREAEITFNKSVGCVD